jgi:hypothetical protein
VCVFPPFTLCFMSEEDDLETHSEANLSEFGNARQAKCDDWMIQAQLQSIFAFDVDRCD